MSVRTKSRVGAILAVGLLLGVGDIAIHATRHAMGKAAFLASQAEQFDRMYSASYGMLKSVVLGVVMAVVVLGVYEAIAAGLLAAIRPKEAVSGGGA